jgi:hypothetical protein
MKGRKIKTDSAGCLGLPVGPSKLDNEVLSSVNGGRFPDQLSNFQILKKDTAK